MNVTSDPPSPIYPVGSDVNVTLTCIVELTYVVDTSLNVSTSWTGPDDFMMTSAAEPNVGNTTTYTSMVTISLFGRHKSGLYQCNATISSVPPLVTVNGSVSATANIIYNC